MSSGAFSPFYKSSLFKTTHEGEVLYIVIYVDDLLLISTSSTELRDDTLTTIGKKFKYKDGGALTWT